jgi:hypothetical protein
VARGIVLAVFVIPVILSLIFGTIVMAEVLQEPDRELNMLRFVSSEGHITSSNSITILGLEKEYSTSSPVKIQVTVEDRTFDCGDLYITIYNIDTAKEQVVTQSGFFGQCFDRNNSILPVDDEFSQIIDSKGTYKVVISVIDKQQKETISTSAKFKVN